MTPRWRSPGALAAAAGVCGCVFCVLKSCLDSTLHEPLARELPEEVCDWFRAA